MARVLFDQLAGDVLATYDSATDITTVNLYVNNDAMVDGTLLLTGDHHNPGASALYGCITACPFCEPNEP